MTLRLVGGMQYQKCEVCDGKGHVPVPRNFNAQGKRLPTEGSRQPCPACKGRKVVIK